MATAGGQEKPWHGLLRLLFGNASKIAHNRDLPSRRSRTTLALVGRNSDYSEAAVTLAPPLLQADWNSAHESLAQLAAGYDEVARFLSDLFGKWETLWSDFLGRQRAWQAEEARARQELEARLEHERAEWAVERERLRVEAARTHGDLARPVDPDQPDPERIALETELEAVRTRAAELGETLAQQGRQIAEERAAWSSELKRMSGLLESLVDRKAQAPVVVMPEPRMTAPRPMAGDDDPVLSSVMAQFEMLQRDLSRRRKAAEPRARAELVGKP